MSNKNVLIITPYSDFGAIINQSLENNPSLNVTVASTIFEIQAYLKNNIAYQYALLDLDLGEKKVLDLGFSLRGNFPSIEIILTSKKEPSREMDELRPWKLLQKPFIQSDLDNLFQNGKSNNPSGSEVIDLDFIEGVDFASHAWWDDEIRVTKTLMTAISNLDIQEAILFSSEEVLAQAGKMDVAAVEECSKLVGKFKLDANTSEILKPIHLKTTKTEHFIHANILAVGILLALLFDADTPLKNIRVQSRYLTNILKNPQLATPEERNLAEISNVSLDEKHLELIHEQIQSLTLRKRTANSHHPRLMIYSSRIRKSQKGSELAPKMVESPSITGSRVSANNQPTSDDTPQSDKHEEQHSTTRRNNINLSHDGEGRKKSDWVQDTLHWKSPMMPVSGETRHFSLCSPDLSFFDVYYTCLLIPRLKSQSLDGDIADFLKEVLPELFLANGWRMEAMEIGPSSLQWLVRIPPTIAPTEHINMIRTQSSRKILGNFTRLNRDELLKDFWAPGFLLGAGQSLFNPEDIIEFIQLNRKHYYPDESIYSIPGSKYQVSHSKY
jgi:REP element-mobilizing transposase RayT